MSTDVTAWLDGLELLHGAAYRGVEDTRRLTMEHDAIPSLVAAVRGALELADEMDADLAAKGFILDRCIRPGDRLRTVVATAITGGQS